MINLKQLIDDHGSKIKYSLFLVLLLAMILSIRTYINYITIVDTIDSTGKKTASVEEELNYANNFQTKYLASEYGHLFLAHDNNVIFWGESIISFKNWTWEDVQARTMSLSHIPDRREVEELERIQMIPQESWQTFIRERIEK